MSGISSQNMEQVRFFSATVGHQPAHDPCRIITHNISTALIMESDGDWDMRIKDIMPKFATGVKNIIDWPFEAPHHTQDPRITPYGDSWDVLWMGHCGSSHDGNIRKYTFNDTSAPPLDREWINDSGLQWNQRPPGTRSVYQFGRTTCSTAYAISLEGAKKLVVYFRTGNMNLDIRLSEVCTQEVDMTCMSVWPQIITAAHTESNIDHTGNGMFGGSSVDHEKKLPHVSPGPGLQFSARVNAKGVLEKGVGPSDWFPQWNTSWGEINGTWGMVEMNETNIVI